MSSQNIRKRRIIHTQVIHNGKKYVKISVPITVHLVMINGKEEEVTPCSEWRKVELAIEAVDPNWFHKILPGGKHAKDCPRCKKNMKA